MDTRTDAEVIESIRNIVNRVYAERDNAQDDANALRAQRDELAAALRKADAWVEQYQNMPGHDAAARSMLRVIRTALARLS